MPYGLEDAEFESEGDFAGEPASVLSVHSTDDAEVASDGGGVSENMESIVFNPN